MTASVVDPLAGSGWGRIVFTLVAALGCALVYQSLLAWMLARTGTPINDETSTTAGALLMTMAFGDLVVAGVAPGRLTDPGSLAFWQTQADLMVIGTSFIVLGAALWIAPLAGLGRDRRMWLVATALLIFVVLATAGAVDGGLPQPLVRLGWLAGALLLVLTRWVPATDRPAGPGRAIRSSIFGSLLVVLAGLLVLVTQIWAEDEAGGAVTVLVLCGVLLAGQRLVVMVGELTQLSQTRRAALTDELTGVANRRSLLAAIDTAVDEGRRSILMIIDLDRFKEVNDRYGHAAGDRLLRHVSGTFSRNLPPGALLARLGGDEFAVLADDLSLVSAAGLAERLAGALTPLDDTAGRLRVGASVGVAVLDTSATAGMTGSELLRRADVAMYQAKSSGAGVKAYNRTLDTQAQEQRQLLEDLQVALRGNGSEQIVVHFQPQVDVNNGDVVGAEALVRWEHPRLGLLTPDRFLDLVEENGLMAELTLRVLDTAMANSGRWRRDGHELRVSVNLSATCLTNPMLLPAIDEILSDHRARPEHLLLEVTETSLMTNPDEALHTLRAITERGVGLSIDDYGTGYSSLSYMNILPAGELKIDRSFTVRLADDPRTAAIVAGTAELAHRLGMRLVAEGTEDDEALERVRALGCDVSQGYLHSRPLPPEGFQQWLSGRTVVPL